MDIVTSPSYYISFLSDGGRDFTVNLQTSAHTLNNLYLKPLTADITYTVVRINAKISDMLTVHEWLQKIKHSTCLRQYDSTLASSVQVTHDSRQLPQLAYTVTNTPCVSTTEPRPSTSHYRQHCAQRKPAGIKFTQRPILRFFALQGWHVAPIGVKFGMEEGTEGPLLHQSPPACQISPPPVQRQGCRTPKFKFLLRFDRNVKYKHPTGAYPLRDFHKSCTICTSF